MMFMKVMQQSSRQRVIDYVDFANLAYIEREGKLCCVRYGSFEGVVIGLDLSQYSETKFVDSEVFGITSAFEKIVVVSVDDALLDGSIGLLYSMTYRLIKGLRVSDIVADKQSVARLGLEEYLKLLETLHAKRMNVIKHCAINLGHLRERLNSESEGKYEVFKTHLANIRFEAVNLSKRIENIKSYIRV
jgi:hypothetical protein